MHDLEFMLDDISVAVSEEDAIIKLSGHANCSNEEDKDVSNFRLFFCKQKSEACKHCNPHF